MTKIRYKYKRLYLNCSDVRRVKGALLDLLDSYKIPCAHIQRFVHLKTQTLATRHVTRDVTRDMGNVDTAIFVLILNLVTQAYHTACSSSKNFTQALKQKKKSMNKELVLLILNQTRTFEQYQ